MNLTKTATDFNGGYVDERQYLARDYLISEYLDWRNNYLSPAVFAEHREITEEQGMALIELARSVFHSSNPNE